MADAMRKPGDCIFDAGDPAVHNEFLIQKGALRSDPSALVWMVCPAAGAPREQKAALLDNAKTLRDVNAVNVAQVLGYGAKGGAGENGYVILSRQPVTLADIWAERAASAPPGAEALQADTRTLCRALGDLLQGMAFLHEQGIVLGSLDPSMVEMSADMQTIHIVCLPLVPLDKGRMLRWCPSFQSPESFRDEEELGEGSDVYALGMLAWAALIGPHHFERAFLGEGFSEDRTMAWKNWHRSPTRAVPALPDYRPVFGMERVQSVLEQMVRRGETGARHETALEALADLDTTMQQLGWSDAGVGDAVTVILPQKQKAPPKVVRYTRMVLTAGVSVLVLGVGAGGYYYFSELKGRAGAACSKAYAHIEAVQKAALGAGPTATPEAARHVLDAAIADLSGGQRDIGGYRYLRAASQCGLAHARSVEAVTLMQGHVADAVADAQNRAEAARESARALGAPGDMPAMLEGDAAIADAVAQRAKSERLASMVAIAGHYDTATAHFTAATDTREALRDAAREAQAETRAILAIVEDKDADQRDAARAGDAALDRANTALLTQDFDAARTDFIAAREHYAEALEQQLILYTAATTARAEASEARAQAASTGLASALPAFAEAETLRETGENALAARDFVAAQTAFGDGVTRYDAAHARALDIAAWNSAINDLGTLAETMEADPTTAPTKRGEAEAAFATLATMDREGLAPLSPALDPAPAYGRALDAMDAACGWGVAGNPLADSFAALRQNKTPDFNAAAALIAQSGVVAGGCAFRINCAGLGLPDTYISVPAGRYAVPETLGGVLGEGLQSVVIDEPFCIATREIMLTDFATYLNRSGMTPSVMQASTWPPLSRIAPDRIADALSLADAAAYAAWLSQETGHRLALPTPMEWAAAHAVVTADDSGAEAARTMRALPREWTNGDCSADSAGVQSLLMGSQKGSTRMASCSTANKQVPRVGARLIVRERAQ